MFQQQYLVLQNMNWSSIDSFIVNHLRDSRIYIIFFRRHTINKNNIILLYYHFLHNRTLVYKNHVIIGCFWCYQSF